MSDVVSKLQMPEVIEQAILELKGPLGQALRIAISYQEGRLQDLDLEQLSEIGLSAHDMDAHYKQAITQADKLINEL